MKEEREKEVVRSEEGRKRRQGGKERRKVLPAPRR